MINIHHIFGIVLLSFGAVFGAEEPSPEVISKPDVAAIASLAPTHARVSYGEDPAQFVDVYLAKSDKPTPVIIYIHGGAWIGGSAGGITRTDVFGAHNKLGEGVRAVLEQGISVVSVEYRFITAALKAGAEPPVAWPLRDAARAVQFVRSKAKEWNLDTKRVGLTGSSAGGCSSLWLAMHPDMADPRSADPVARESTRPAFVGVLNAQTSLDPLQLKDWFKEARYGAHAFGFFKDRKHSVENMDACLAARDTIVPWIREYSPIAWASADDPPVFQSYTHAPQPAGQPQLDSVHGAAHGVKLKEMLDRLAVQCQLTYPGAPHPGYRDHLDFLIRKLKPEEDSRKGR